VTRACRLPALLALVIIIGLPQWGAAQAGKPLSVCLAKEWIAVAAVHRATTLEGGGRPIDQSLMLTGRVQGSLRDLGSEVVATRVGQPIDNASQRRLGEADRNGATMLLSVELVSSEYRINSIYLRDPYPLRTVDMRLTAQLFDVPSRTSLATMQIPERHIAANSTDAATGEFFSQDLTNDFAALLRTACEQVGSRPEIRHEPRTLLVQGPTAPVRLPPAEVEKVVSKSEEAAMQICKDVEQSGAINESKLSGKIEAEAGLLRRLAGITNFPGLYLTH
jgi:hypothetical protein